MEQRRIGLMSDIHMEELLALMEYYCDPNLPILTHEEAQVLVGIEPPMKALAKGIDIHHSIYRAVFSHLFCADVSARLVGAELLGPDLRVDRPEMLKRAPSDDDAASLVLQWLRLKISHTLGLAPEEIDLTRPAHTYGIDSLVAIDLKNWFDREVGTGIQVFTLLGNVSLEELGKDGARRSRFRDSTLATQSIV